MRKAVVLHWMPFLVLVIFLAGCAGRAVRDRDRSLRDGRYDSEFPSGNTSETIGEIAGSIMKLYSISHYTTYQFTRETEITSGEIRTGKFRHLAFGIITTHETSFGTVTLICREQDRAVLLTCAHVVDAPDTLATWYEPDADNPVPYLKSISILEKQEHFIRELAACGSFAILAIDSGRDLALIGRQCDGLSEDIQPLKNIFGAARQLDWGSFVYLLGYPMGQLVVTKGIVSSPNSTDKGGFTVDALLNKGFSGGIILAIRDGVPNLEVVGLVRSVASEQEYFLTPDNPFGDCQYSPHVPYRGDPYVESKETLTYGVNFVLPVEIIRDFYRENRDTLISAGYDLDTVLGERSGE